MVKHNHRCKEDGNNRKLDEDKRRDAKEEEAMLSSK
jgi:hypothetical protein